MGMTGKQYDAACAATRMSNAEIARCAGRDRITIIRRRKGLVRVGTEAERFILGLLGELRSLQARRPHPENEE